MPPEIYGAIRLAEKHEAVALNLQYRYRTNRRKQRAARHLRKAQKLRHRAARLGEQP